MTMDEKIRTREDLIALSGAYWACCTLQGAVALDIFTAIGPGKTAEETAAAIGATNRGTMMLLNALVAMNLLTKEGATYHLTEISRNLLVRGAPDYMGHIIMHHHHLVPSWHRLAEAVRTGESQRVAVTARADAIYESFIMGMYNIARLHGPAVAGVVDLSGRRSLLDLGGGSGAYAVEFCKANPLLRAVVFDLPRTRPLAEKIFAAAAMTDRLRFMGGDYLRDDLGGPYDAAWLSQILHGEGLETCVALLKRTFSVLERGGVIAVHEFILNDTLDGPLQPALFSLNMLLGTAEGRSYAQGELMDMMEKAGFRDVRRLPYQSRNGAGILVAVK